MTITDTQSNPHTRSDPSIPTTAGIPTFATPLTIGAAVLRNRFVSAPMERNYGTVDGLLTREYIDYIVRRARGGAALIFTEASYVRADGKGRIRQLGVDTDECIPGLTTLAHEVHEHGALLGVELNHGGRTAQGSVSGFVPVAPSPIPCEVVGGQMPEQLDADDIEHIIECFADAAERCHTAGVDVISLHGGHGYLIHQFLSPAYNHRSDEWAEPTLFVNRVIGAVRDRVPDMTLGLRFSAFEGSAGGLTAEQTRERMADVATDKLDFLDVSAGNYEAGQWIIQPGEWERGLLRDHADPYAREFDIPVGVAGRISSPETAEAILTSGKADFLSMARTLHADPDFPNRAIAGERYRPCIACNFCIDSLAAGPIPCTVNPWVGREAAEPEPSVRPIRVAVVGGGMAGLGAARELARLGHHVDMYEQREYLGGDFALAARLREYPEYRRIIDWYLAEIEVLDISCHTGVRVDATTFGVSRPDAIVLATGADGHAPDLDVADRTVRDVRDFLRSGDRAPAAVTIYGADREAAAVADDLLAHGTRVVMIGPQETIAHDVGRRAKIVLLPRLAADPNLTAHLAARVTSVREGKVQITDADGQRWVDAPGELLVSQGIEPSSELLVQLRSVSPPLGVHAIGDAGRDGGSVQAALVTAVDIAREIDFRAGEAASA
ncbi:FAD-dependent oxidoreductase [Gordonia sp. NB41Y]|uniref:oxidoreductase n=1 Tax=Gordonia sp. NB41Y TaxID=875808 RepID=UPI0009E749CB|nr:FAD-dependent oxidoreductase [Gordonia sp. NB41Y]WLP90757.1 FAD-dependent oxidoreductase [Gordonia sp. NB41Y]